MTAEQINNMFLLFNAVREGTSTDEQLSELDQLLAQDAKACKYYIEYINMCTLLKSGKAFDQEHLTVPEICDVYFWKSMADYEKNAPVFEIPKEKRPHELIQEVVYPPRKRLKVSKLNICFLALNAAAVLFLVLFVKFAPSKKGVEVATLINSFDAKWIDVDDSMEIGTRLAAGSDNFCLSEGFVTLLFDNNAKVVIEGPAEFELLAEDRIGLTYGKTYAIVPQEAVGFSVYTENAKVIDLGTEFGVEVNTQGDTYLNVVKGQTQLIAGEKSDLLSTVVRQETAMMVSSNTGVVSNISYDEDRFVRSFDSTHKVVWRQQPSLDLADIVRNGNGLGTGNSQVRLNYIQGFTTDQRGGATLIAEDYLPIKDHPFIDGIFIPDEKAIVSSRGDVFEKFLKTSGVHCADLFGNPVPGSLFLDEQRKTIQFDGQEYSERGKSCIFMPGSNHGVTFDLDAIRSRYNLKIDRFTSRVGLADYDNKRCNANFYVLVDGQLRYSLLGYTQKGVLNDVLVKLEDTDRFLTLATTENVDQIDYMANSTLYENWCVFTEPVLVME